MATAETQVSGLQQLWASRAAPQLEKEDLLNRVRDLETQIRLNMREVHLPLKILLLRRSVCESQHSFFSHVR